MKPRLHGDVKPRLGGDVKLRYETHQPTDVGDGSVASSSPHSADGGPVAADVNEPGAACEEKTLALGKSTDRAQASLDDGVQCPELICIYKCMHCNNFYKSRSALMNHLYAHTGEFDFSYSIIFLKHS